MAEVITKENYRFYKEQGVIDEMHKQRFRTLFSDDDDSQKWDADGAGIEHGYDRDDYDHDDTIYLIERHPETALYGLGLPSGIVAWSRQSAGDGRGGNQDGIWQ